MNLYYFFICATWVGFFCCSANWRSSLTLMVIKCGLKDVVIQQMLYFRVIMRLHRPVLLCLAAALLSTFVTSYP